VHRSAIIAVVLAAGACSGGKAAVRPIGTVAPAVTVTATSAGSGAGLDPCALVTLADVKSVLPGLDIVAGQSARQPTGGDCPYLVNQTSRTVDVKVVRPNGVSRFDELQSLLPDTVPIPGIGDRAVSQRAGSTVAAVKGSALVEVVAENDDGAAFKAAVLRLLQIAVSRLPAT
jgi:hypothetical protein